jgi:hypothetical protein
MYEHGLIDPVFSMVMNRNASNGTAAGFLTLGGLPPMNITGNFSTTPILITNIKGYPKTYDFYTINIDGATVDTRSLPEAGGQIQYLVSIYHTRLKPGPANNPRWTQERRSTTTQTT